MFGIERILYPNNTEETFTYDCIGNVIEKTSGDRVIHYQYNTASQLIRVEYPDSFVTFTYDENGNRITMEDQYSSAVYVYDSRNRLVSETKTIDSINYTTSYDYDAASNVISLSYPDGTVITHEYDNLNRLTFVNGYAQFSWDENSQLEQISYQNDILTNYLYDLRGRPTQIKSTKNGNDLLNLTYTYDPAGNVTQMKNQDVDQVIKEQWDYTYDPLNRLKTAAGGPSGQDYSLTYQYDSTGNRTQLNNTVYTYNEMNELLAFNSGNENCILTYDVYGNCIQKEDGTNVWEYSYDYENRLTSVKENGQVVEQYLYDGDGNRIKKIDSDSERIYIHNGLNVLYEVNVTTQMNAVYIHGPAGRIAKKVNDMQEYYHTDHLGSTKLVTTENGVVTEEIMYEPFGKQINATEERYTYNGKELDESGLYYYGARYYDPEIGRFMSRDLLTGKKESPETLNRYVYCLNNPLKYVDPAGTVSADPQETAEEVFRRLQYIDPNAFNEVQALLDAGKQLEALMKILELLGFDPAYVGKDTLSVQIGDYRYKVKVDNNLADWGQTNNDSNVRTISINFSSGKVGDMTLTVLHEVCHAILGDSEGEEQAKEQHQSIYNVEYSYYVALRAAGVEFSNGDIRKHEPNFMQHIKNMTGSGFGFDSGKQVPLSEITYRWVRGLTVQW